MVNRQFTSRKRISGVKEANIIVIATEGECTEKQYFEEIQVRKGKTNIHVEILPTEDCRSSPEDVLNRLDDYKKRYALNLNSDQLWMVIDVDQWGDIKLSQVARTCVQKKHLVSCQ